jgi:hypothetical protein
VQLVIEEHVPCISVGHQRSQPHSEHKRINGGEYWVKPGDEDKVHEDDYVEFSVIDKDDVVIFSGMDVFRTFTVKIKNDDLFHYQTQARPNGEFFLPGTDIRVIGTPGLNGKNGIYAMRLSNMWLGTDLMDEDQNRWELFFAK